MTASPAPLDEFLRRLHLGSSVYYVGQLCDTWHMSTSGGDGTRFHLVAHGCAWVHLPNRSEPIALNAGDIAFFPGDAPHSISSMRQVDEHRTFSYGRPVVWNSQQPGTGLLCGQLKLPQHMRRLLLASFPDVLIVHPRSSVVGRQLHGLIDLMAEEAALNQLGVTAVLDKLSDSLFLFVIRHALHLDPKLSPLLAAFADEYLRAALTAFVDRPSEPWTVERMAQLACLSRSSFAERFTQWVGMPVMEFVATWRMQLAVGWLAEENANMLDVAMRCGYESESAFRKAFKRIIGVAPGRFRMGLRTTPAGRPLSASSDD